MKRLMIVSTFLLAFANAVISGIPISRTDRITASTIVTADTADCSMQA